MTCSLLFEQVIEGFANIVALNGWRSAARSQRDALVRLEKIAEVRLQLIAHVLGLTFAALVVFARIEEAAVFTAMHIRIAVWTFVPALDFAYSFDFSTTVMTNHKAPCKRLESETG